MTNRPRLLALATAVPPHALSQQAVSDRARLIFGKACAADFERMAAVFGNAGIARRYSAVPVEWYERPHGWPERNALYLTHALELAAEAARKSLAIAGLEAAEIDAVVVVSTTGIATPSLDARLIDRIGLRSEVRRLPIFGLGCAGGKIQNFHQRIPWGPKSKSFSLRICFKVSKVTRHDADSSSKSHRPF